jgi:hypothetical protein
MFFSSLSGLLHDAAGKCVQTCHQSTYSAPLYCIQDGHLRAYSFLVMIRSLKGISNYTAYARDGKIGSVKDLFFDDELWRIRYFVFETGGFLTRQRVLIAPPSISIEEQDGETIVRVDLTMDQIRNSPDIDADKPVSRQYEMEMASYYGWPTYWTMEPVGAVPLGTPVAEPPSEPTGDPHREASTRWPSTTLWQWTAASASLSTC